MVDKILISEIKAETSFQILLTNFHLWSILQKRQLF